ncbi:universal stress protein [Synechococcus sp. A18-25c]|uniref:universal stress protein n=1 Tax=unclassified Synechococcus TaxID=2626047 RepID=UPI00164510ED|nr:MULTISPECIES: universal stress protein [unclassified Synechococcus]MEC7249158.1 universal stress protein [Cyanobacteriota bacterium]MEC7896955.1 universal stress protein [Cyanobacteriota bacterium]QNI49467.1 universal stress protein [Synechococcus sp. A15-60]QNI74764.1 universal stress protein [Synechococcus sp. NOUM97013]QNJ21080.1 universal stress protein [Synechococcus sp. A18-25c]|tara:strand:+ start:331 stop:714 length:384 start_codon:yes stop_codon:yes gene_type:complete
MFETVLFPIDQSRQALETAGKALELARSHSSRLVLLSVVQPERPEMHDHEAVAALLSQTRERFEQAGVACDEVEREGKPAFVICDVADELNVDVIVMGTRGVKLEAEAGSTAARVIQLAPCPVLVVP